MNHLWKEGTLKSPGDNKKWKPLTSHQKSLFPPYNYDEIRCTLSAFVRVLEYWDQCISFHHVIRKKLFLLPSWLLSEDRPSAGIRTEVRLKGPNKLQKSSYKSQELKLVWLFITVGNGKPTAKHTDRWNALSIHLFNGTLVHGFAMHTKTLNPA